MTDDTPRAPDGAKLCAWCGGQVRQSGVGRSRDYCKQSCRQRAYEERRVQERLRVARHVAARAVSSRGETEDEPVPSRDEMRPDVISPRDETGSVQATAPIPAPTSEAVPPERPVEPPPLPRVSRRRSAMTGSAMPLPWELPDADGG